MFARLLRSASSASWRIVGSGILVACSRQRATSCATRRRPHRSSQLVALISAATWEKESGAGSTARVLCGAEVTHSVLECDGRGCACRQVARYGDDRRRGGADDREAHKRQEHA